MGIHVIQHLQPYIKPSMRGKNRLLINPKLMRKKSLVNSHDTAENGDHLLCIKPLVKIEKLHEEK